MSTNLRNPADRRDYPARWTMRRGKVLFREIDERSADGSEELLSVSHITGITPRSQKNVTMFQSESLVGYKICRPGDIAANTMWTWQGAIGVSDYFGVISPSYNVYRQRQDTYNPRYLDFLLREPKLVDVYYSLSTGIRPSRRRLYPDEFLTIRFPVPPRVEQDKIVRFLDEKANAIDEVIATRQKQIDELHELRKTIINHVVTRGTRERNSDYSDRLANARPKGVASAAWSSGVLETREIPQNSKTPSSESKRSVSVASDKSEFETLPDGWKMTRVKNVAIISNGSDPKTEGDIPVYGSGECHFKTCGEYKEGPVVLLGRKGSIDIPRYVEGKYWNVDTAFDVHMKDNNSIRWFYYIAFVFDYDFYSSRTTVPSMTQTDYGNMRIPLPPVDEQREIAAYLDEKCAAIDKAIENRKAAIEELVALKARIVADAVTGRMEVE